jgi:uncharacterized protein (DUF488 family)
MNTSYFSRFSHHPNAISIAHTTPASFLGRIYSPLAPPWWLISAMKQNKITKEEYKRLYYRDILNKLDPQEVFAELGPDAILCCYERPDDFCHRHIVAEWLSDALGITVEEIL